MRASRFAGAALVAIIAFAAAGACSRPAPRDDIVWNPKNHDAVVAAMAEARSALPIFWRHYDAKVGGEGDFLLKAPFPTRHGGQEHMWLAPTRRSPTEVVGRLVDTPEDVKGLKPGDEVRVATEDISDWSYTKGETIYGNFTTRLMVDEFGAEEREYAKRHFSPQPLEAEDQ